jgi:hypothetical protein
VRVSRDSFFFFQGASKVSLTFDATTTNVLKCGSSKFTEAAATDSIVHTLAGGGQASV